MYPLGLESMCLQQSAGNYSNQRDRMLSRALKNGFPYSRILSASKSCVNALSFSSGDGRWLATGGDDLKVFLWDLHQDDLAKPTGMLRGHRGNIFCVEFSANNRFIFSGGIDDLIVQYDLSVLDSTPQQTDRMDTNVFFSHDDNIRGISAHPYKDEIFLSAASDGRIIRHDTRERTARRSQVNASDMLQLSHEATDVRYHPFSENLFATSDSYGNVCLRDMRMAFGGFKERRNEGVVLDYATRLTRRIGSTVDMCHPEVSSIAFDKEGEKLAVTFLYSLPTIYGLSDPYPLAVCDGKILPDGTRAKDSDGRYFNGCTIKHGTFGSAGLSSDQLYAAGSEDFRGYVWKIPSTSELMQRRTEIDVWDWQTADIPSGTQAFTVSSSPPNAHSWQCIVPTPLDTPFCRLTGHKSIVNSVIIHPQMPYIVTCGVEKNVLLHSISPHAPGAGEEGLRKTSKRVRKVGGEYIPGPTAYSDAEHEETQDEERDRERRERDMDIYMRALEGLGPPDDESGEETERLTISMFDHILRQEGDGDVFELRKCGASGGDDDSSDEEMQDDDDDEGGLWIDLDDADNDPLARAIRDTLAMGNNNNNN